MLGEGSKGMRSLAVLAACLLMLTALAPLSAAAPPAFTFVDVKGDATQGQAPASGAVADGVDVVQGSFEEQDGSVRFTLEMVDLEAMESETRDTSFHVQYALSFTTSNGDWYSARAMFGGLLYTIVPVGGWTFQWHDRNADEWVDADGRRDGNTLVWDVAPSALGLADGDRIAGWEVQTWASRDGADQVGDWASATQPYVLGAGPVTVPDTAASITSGALIADPEGDVEGRDGIVTGGGVPATDILKASIGEAGADLVFTLALVDLESVQDEPRDPNYHVQYAFSFITRDGHDGYSMRALYEGPGRNGAASAGGWSFNMHDRDADEWPAAHGWLDGSTLVWQVPRSAFDVATGTELREIGVSTWASFDERDQYGDRAQAEATYVVGAPGSNETLGSPDENVLDAELPGFGALAGLAALAVVLRRRR